MIPIAIIVASCVAVFALCFIVVFAGAWHLLKDL